LGFPVFPVLKRIHVQYSTCIKAAQASAREGVKNGVTVTPTVFINSKRYRSYKDPRWIVDAALFEYESLNRSIPEGSGKE
jgi:hypothetical protein